jgi:hypothetical protein
MEQARMVTHNQLEFTPPQRTHGAPGPSTPTELPPTIIPDVLPSYVQSYTPPAVQTSPQWTNKEHDIEPDVGPGAERDHVESVSPEASTRPSKKRKDMLRKRDQRAEDRQHFASICALLEIPLTPNKTLSHRSAYPCIHTVTMSLKELCAS